jgi:hypothetical protein
VSGVALLLIEYRLPTEAVADYDTWKAVFDTDPIGRKAMGATRHRIYRNAFEPNHFYLTMEFRTPEGAKGFLDHPMVRQSWHIAGATEGRVLTEVEFAHTDFIPGATG